MMKTVLAAILLLLIAPQVAANPQVVQFVTGWPSGSAASSTTSAITTTTGNTLIAMMSTFTNQIGATPISDSGGHTWTQAIASTGTTEGWVAMFYVANITGQGSHTFTFTPNAGAFQAFTVIEVSGLAASPLNHTDVDSSTGSVDHATGPIAADAGICELFIAGGGNSDSGSSQATPTVSLAWFYHYVFASSTHQGLHWAWREVASGGSDSYSYQTGATDRDTAFIAGFKSATACTSTIFPAPTSGAFVQ
jgi:hypothetical protein